MKLAVLLTGQIRDEEKFRKIILQLLKVRNLTHAVTFASWSRDVERARQLFDEIAPGLVVNFADCAGAIPLNGRLNRDAGSLLAQFEQLCIGAEHTPECETAYTLRIRADMENPEILSAIIEVASNHLASSSETRSFIIGAGTQCFFFFEDRIMLLSPGHLANIRALRLSSLTKYSTYNIFPEYTFYATACGASETFLRYDARYRERHIPQGRIYTAYDFSYHGQHYSRIMSEYKDIFESSFVFFDDIFKVYPAYAGISSRIPRYHTWYTKAEYFEALDRLSLVYNDELAAYNSIGGKVLGPDRTFSEAELLAEVLLLYQEGKNDELVTLVDGLGPVYLFSEQIWEFFGCSLYIVGSFEKAEIVLQDLYDRGYSGFELMFYLLLLKARYNDLGGFIRVANRYLAAHGDNARAQEHVDALSRSFGKEAVVVKSRPFGRLKNYLFK